MAVEMTEKRPKVCAVVLNIGGMPVMEDCLRSLAAADYPGLEVILVHNGPLSPGLEEAARRTCPRIARVIFTGANMGFAAGNNHGIKAALARGAEYVLLMNDDAYAAPDFLEPLVAALDASPGAGFAGPRIFYSNDPRRIWSSGASLDRGNCSFSYPGAEQDSSSYGHLSPESSDYATGCAVLIKRSVIESAGPLDERFFLYWEDADWGLRAAEAGFMSLVVPGSKVWHKVSYSAGGDNSPLKVFHRARGRLAFSRRHCPGCFAGMPMRLLRDAAWLAFKSGRPGGIRRAAALLAGILSYFAGGTGPGPGWLRKKRIS